MGLIARLVFASVALVNVFCFTAVNLFCIEQAITQPTPRVDLYGDLLPAKAFLRLGTIRLRHGSHVLCVVFAPDGKALASAADDHTVRLWDPTTGKEIRRLVGHEDVVWAIALSPDGRRLISTGWDDTVRLWDVSSGMELHRFQGVRATCVAFSPDGKTIAAGDAGKIIIWDAATGAQLQTLTKFGKGFKLLTSLVFAPDLKTVIFGHDQGMDSFDLDNGKRGPYRSDAPTVSVLFSRDGKALISGHVEYLKKIDRRTGNVNGGSYEGAVQIWDATTGKETKNWKWLANSTSRLALSADGRQLAATAEDNSILIWDSATGKTLARLDECRNWPVSLAFSPDGTTLAAGTLGPAIQLWDIPTRSRIHKNAHQDVATLVVSSANQLLATTDGGREVFLWELPTGKALQTLTAPHGTAFCIGFTADGQRLVWGHKSGKDNAKPLTVIQVWSVAKGEEIFTWHCAEYMEDVALSPDGRWLMSTGSLIRLWNVETGKEHRRFGQVERKVCISFSPDSMVVAAASSDALRWWDVISGKEVGSLKIGNLYDFRLHLLFPTMESVLVGNSQMTILYDLSRKEKMFTINHEQRFWGVSVAPNGKMLVTSSGTKMRFFDLPSKKILREFDVSYLPGKMHRFSPDGRSLVVYGEYACILETSTGKERQRFERPGADIDSARISANGKYLITAHADSTVIVWELSGK